MAHSFQKQVSEEIKPEPMILLRIWRCFIGTIFHAMHLMELYSGGSANGPGDESKVDTLTGRRELGQINNTVSDFSL